MSSEIGVELALNLNAVCHHMGSCARQYVSMWIATQDPAHTSCLLHQPLSLKKNEKNSGCTSQVRGTARLVGRMGESRCVQLEDGMNNGHESILMK